MSSITHGWVTADAQVRRTKQNYMTICTAKLATLPQTGVVATWMEKVHFKLDGLSPRQAIEADQGHQAERLVEELVHMHEAFSALAELHGRYRNVPELDEMWVAFIHAWPRYRSIIGG